MRWLSECSPTQAGVTKRNLVRIVIGTVALLLAGTAAAFVWVPLFERHWPGEPAALEVLDVAAGQHTSYWWDELCTTEEQCIWYYYCYDTCCIGSACMPNGTYCAGWNNGRCTNQRASGYWCVQRRWDDVCCFAYGTCQLTFSGAVVCTPPSPGRRGQWWECWYDVGKPPPGGTVAGASR